MDKLLYRPREAAAALGISKTVLYDLIRSNRIRSIKDGKFPVHHRRRAPRLRPNTGMRL
jgi:excisionase family DNA binding protein